MSNPNRKEELARRRVFVRSLLNSLSAEMRAIDEELRGMNAPQRPRLDQKFYEGVLVPLLINEPQGMTTGELLKALKESDFTVGDNQLRVFLSRAAGEKGWLERVERASGPSKWKLAAKARTWGLRPEEN